MNQQRLVLLSPALHSDPNPARGGSDIAVQDSMRLVAANRSDDQIFVPKNDQISLYTVKEGDNLSQIADIFEVSVNTIRWANDLGSGSAISPGDQLVILPVSGIKHVIKSGDTLAKLAKEYESDTVEIALFNGLDEGGLKVGDEVIIPNGELHNNEYSSAKSSSQPKASANTNGYFTHPAPGTRRTQGIHGRNAVDLAAASGTPVFAAATGTVIISKAGGWNGGYGSYIVVKHNNGTQTLYSHLSGNNVSVGDWVTKGSRIGSIGNTGKSTGPHLHFEVRGGKNPF
jgi:murein DD-endopeptidase MepM/ murein hydrolase activator NlpD